MHRSTMLHCAKSSVLVIRRCALQYGALIGMLFAGIMAISQRLLRFDGVVDAAMKGARVVLPAIAILWCALTVSRMTGNKAIDGAVSIAFEHQDHRLYTGEHLKTVLSERFSSKRRAFRRRSLCCQRSSSSCRRSWRFARARAGARWGFCCRWW